MKKTTSFHDASRQHFERREVDEVKDELFYSLRKSEIILLQFYLLLTVVN